MLRLSRVMVGLAVGALFVIDSTPTAAQVEEIIVTARKREESVQDVPIAVQAFDTEMIEKYAATNLNEIVEMSNQVLAFGQASGNGGVFYIRGQGTGSLDPGLESSVVINIDGVQVDRGHIHRQAFFDMKNVQVLKGPQALFYGKNSPAGVISLESADPSDVLEASVQLAYETEAEEVTGEVMVSGPITETLGARLAYRYTDMDGYLNNNATFVAHSGQIFPDEPFDFPGAAEDKVGGSDSNTVRLTLQWTPRDDFDARFKLLYGDYETDNFATIENLSCSGSLPITFTLSGFAGLAPPFFGNVGTADADGDCEIDQELSQGSLPRELAATFPDAGNGDPYGEYESWLTSLDLTWDITDEYTLNSVTGIYYYDYTRWDNFDGTNFIQFMGIQLEDQTTWSQELRLDSNYGGKFNFMVGAFYEHFERDSDNHGKIFSWGFDPVTGQSNNWSGKSTVESDSWSVFGQVIYDITDTLELTAGARYTEDDRDADQRNSFVHGTDGAYAALGIWCGGVTPCNPFFSPQGLVIKSDFDDDNVSPEVTLTWRPQDNITLWGAYREGYKAGGFSTNTVITFGADGDSLTFDPETVDAWEAGIKTVLFDGSLRLNANAYFYQYDDQQVSAFDNATTSFTINNAAESESKGVEVEGEFFLLDNFIIRAQIGYNNAEYSDFPNAPCWAGQTPAQGCVTDPTTGADVQDLEDQSLGFAPDLSGSIGFDFEQPINANWVFGASYDAIYMDQYKAGGRPETLQPSTWKHNARAGVFHADGTWDLVFIGRNLGDELTIGGCADKPGGAPGDIFCQTVRGRQLMLQATYRL